MDKQKRRPARETIFFALLLPLVIFSLASCKPAAKPAGHKDKADTASQSLQREVLADARKDIAVIEGSRDDPSVLEPAVSGTALEGLKSQMAELKTKGLVKVRDYKNLKLKFGIYQGKVAGVSAEYLDSSRIISIDDGRPQAPAKAEKRKLYLGLAKIDSRWKIISVLSGAQAKPGQ